MKGISSHFKNEAVIMVGFLVLPLILAMLAGFFGPMIMEKIEKDKIQKCHDSGGSYNLENRKCDLLKRKQDETTYQHP